MDTKRAFSKRGQNVRNKPRALKGPSLRSLTMMKMPNFLPKERLLSKLVSVYRVKKREIFYFEPNFSKKIFQNDSLWGVSTWEIDCAHIFRSWKRFLEPITKIFKKKFFFENFSTKNAKVRFLLAHPVIEDWRNCVKKY